MQYKLRWLDLRTWGRVNNFRFFSVNYVFKELYIKELYIILWLYSGSILAQIMLYFWESIVACHQNSLLAKSYYSMFFVRFSLRLWILWHLLSHVSLESTNKILHYQTLVAWPCRANISVSGVCQFWTELFCNREDQFSHFTYTTRMYKEKNLENSYV